MLTCWGFHDTNNQTAVSALQYDWDGHCSFEIIQKNQTNKQTGSNSQNPKQKKIYCKTEMCQKTKTKV